MAFESFIQIYRGVPLDPNYEHTLAFDSREEQKTYFTLPGYTDEPAIRASMITRFTEFSYIRKEVAVKVPADYDRLFDSGVNYAVVQNGPDSVGNPSAPRFYFVRDMEYVSGSCTKLILELDVLQTYQFDWEIPECFIEREHVETEVLSKNILNEGLELGEIVAHSVNQTIELDELCLIIQSSVNLAPGSSFGTHHYGSWVDNVYSGFSLWALPANDTGIYILNRTLSELDNLGKNGIVSLWMYPKALVDDGVNNAIDADDITDPVSIKGTMVELIKGYAPWDIGGYYPRNLKLLTYPYSYAYVYNNTGEGAIFHYELFEDRQPWFKLAGNLANDGVVRLVPQNYRGFANDNESGLSLPGFPTCAWSQDMYKIWMAQNANSQAFAIESANVQTAMGMGFGIVDSIASFATGNISGGIGGIEKTANAAYSGYQKVGSLMAAREDKKAQPPQAKGTQSANCNVVMGMQNFSIANMGVTVEQAKRLDTFFDMYGYLVNTVKKPNYKARPYWNYIKTVGCSVLGDFSAEDRRKIAAIFDKGLTWWRRADFMYKYNEYADDNAVWVTPSEPDEPVNPEPEEPEEPDTPETSYTTMYCNVVEGEYVNVRSGAGTTFDVVGKLHRNDEVLVESIADGWAKIVSPFDGYVMSSFLQEDIPGYG